MKVAVGIALVIGVVWGISAMEPKNSRTTPGAERFIRMRNGFPGTMNASGTPGLQAGTDTQYRGRLGTGLRECDRNGEVCITRVIPGSPATRCRDLSTNELVALEEGDHILAVNGLTVANSSAVVELIRQSSNPLRLVVRDGQSRLFRMIETHLDDVSIGPAGDQRDVDERKQERQIEQESGFRERQIEEERRQWEAEKRRQDARFQGNRYM